MWFVGAYEAVHLLHLAVENTDASTNSVREYLIDGSPHESFSGPVEYTASGESLIPMTLFKVLNGKLLPIDE